MNMIRLQRLLNHARCSARLTAVSDRLADLCEEGISSRESHDEIPSRVEYRLTEIDQALHPIIEAVGNWIDEYGDSTATARSRPSDCLDGRQ